MVVDVPLSTVCRSGGIAPVDVGEVVRLKVKYIDRVQNIIRVEQSKSRKDRNVMPYLTGGPCRIGASVPFTRNGASHLTLIIRGLIIP
jgi:hypothetical protein